jgi:hypothetical protein
VPTITVNLTANKLLKLFYTKVIQKFTLSIKSYINGSEVSGVPISGSISGSTPYSASLDAGTYSITVPDQISVQDVAYNYSRYEEI